jgi:translation initiation factor IF-2
LGSVEVLKKTLGDLPTDKARLRILHAAAGGIMESDVLLADVSKAVIVGFNVVPDPAAQKLAEQKNVTIRLYRVIYDLTDALRRSLQGLLEPEKRMETRGRAEVREVFKVTKVGTVAGCYVTDGLIMRNHKVRVARDGVVVRDEASMVSLRRFKDDVREVRQGMECGIKIANYDDIKVGDAIEAYEIIEVARLL